MWPSGQRSSACSRVSRVSRKTLRNRDSSLDTWPDSLAGASPQNACWHLPPGPAGTGPSLCSRQYFSRPAGTWQPCRRRRLRRKRKSARRLTASVRLETAGKGGRARSKQALPQDRGLERRPHPPMSRLCIPAGHALSYLTGIVWPP